MQLVHSKSFEVILKAEWLQILNLLTLEIIVLVLVKIVLGFDLQELMG